MPRAAPIVLLVVGSIACSSGGPNGQVASRTARPTAAAAPATAACGSFLVRSPDLDGDLAPPTGFTEICSQDHGLCAELTAGYPPGTNTLGYFLVSEEWAARQKSQPVSLSRYVIAQATSTSAASFPALKRFLRERNGVLPDHTVPPDEMANLERFDLGVVDETADSITFGMILQLHASPAHGSLEPQIALNIAFLLHGHVMSLYVHHAFKDRRDVAAAKKLAADWLACLRNDAK